METYILGFSNSVQQQLQQIRQTIQKTAPNATETIKYGIPTFVLNGNLVHFAAYKNHIGLYPTPSAIVAFTEKLKPFKTSKGAIQFPLNQALPLTLITEIVQFRVQQNIDKAKKK